MGFKIDKKHYIVKNEGEYWSRVNEKNPGQTLNLRSVPKVRKPKAKNENSIIIFRVSF